MFNKEKLILTDCDGVLLDWMDSFSKFMLEKGHTVDPKYIDKYSLAKRFNVDRNVMHDYIVEFNNSAHVSNLPPLADSVEYISKLAKLGFRFIVISSMSNTKEAHDLRWKNLQSVYGDVFDELILLDVGKDKYEALDCWYNTELFWIEDKFVNSLIGHAAGLQAILVDADHNQDLITSRFPRVSAETPWKEIYNYVIKDYNIVP